MVLSQVVRELDMMASPLLFFSTMDHLRVLNLLLPNRFVVKMPILSSTKDGSLFSVICHEFVWFMWTALRCFSRCKFYFNYSRRSCKIHSAYPVFVSVEPLFE